MIAFLIMVAFNAYWYIDKGKDNYLAMFSVEKSGSLAYLVWGYAIFGFLCLLI